MTTKTAGNFAPETPNRDGLTFWEWCAAARVLRSAYDGHHVTAWMRADDPIEWRESQAAKRHVVLSASGGYVRCTCGWEHTAPEQPDAENPRLAQHEAAGAAFVAHRKANPPPVRHEMAGAVRAAPLARPLPLESLMRTLAQGVINIHEGITTIEVDSPVHRAMSQLVNLYTSGKLKED